MTGYVISIVLLCILVLALSASHFIQFKSKPVAELELLKVKNVEALINSQSSRTESLHDHQQIKAQHHNQHHNQHNNQHHNQHNNQHHNQHNNQHNNQLHNQLNNQQYQHKYAHPQPQHDQGTQNTFDHECGEQEQQNQQQNEIFEPNERDYLHARYNDQSISKQLLDEQPRTYINGQTDSKLMLNKERTIRSVAAAGPRSNSRGNDPEYETYDALQDLNLEYGQDSDRTQALNNDGNFGKDASFTIIGGFAGSDEVAETHPMGDEYEFTPKSKQFVTSQFTSTVDTEEELENSRKRRQKQKQKFLERDVNQRYQKSMQDLPYRDQFSLAQSGDQMTDSQPTATSMDSEPKGAVYVYDRNLNIQNRRNNSFKGDPIRGDLFIQPLQKSGWFDVRADPASDLTMGAMPFIADLSRVRSVQDLIFK